MSATTTQHLAKLLANSYSIYLKTQNYHWNVTGPMFKSLHDLFEEQYTELAQAIDEIAERMRTNGAYAPGGFKAFTALSEIAEATAGTSAPEMVKNLLEDHHKLIGSAKLAFPLFEQEGDQVSADLLLQRISVHEKTAWMLKSQLEV